MPEPVLFGGQFTQRICLHGFIKDLVDGAGEL
jgi:hypothetical protein